MVLIKFVTSDNKKYEVDAELFKCSGFVKTKLEGCGSQQHENIEVSLPSINSAIFDLILTWATHHKDDAPMIEHYIEHNPLTGRRSDDISPWDAGFINLNQGTLFRLIMGAFYLDIKGLVDLACKHVANMIRNRTTAEIREIFNIRNDFTPEEEERLL